MLVLHQVSFSDHPEFGTLPARTQDCLVISMSAMVNHEEQDGTWPFSSQNYNLALVILWICQDQRE